MGSDYTIWAAIIPYGQRLYHVGSNYTVWAAIIPYEQRLYHMGSDYTIQKVGIIGYYKTQCALLVAFTKLLYANDLKQRWAKLLLYVLISVLTREI